LDYTDVFNKLITDFANLSDYTDPLKDL